ncbi:MAG: GAF domain-containing protein [Opitutae bacterium]|nr:GAF domain-containing protein [Opitutae bacterium]
MIEPAPRDLAALHRIAALATSAADAAAASRAILAEIMPVFAADSGSVSLLNPHTGYLEIVTQQGLPRETGEFALKLGQGVTGWVTVQGQPLLVPDVAAEPRYIAARANVRCEMAAPLLAHGQSVGVINVDADRVNAYGPAELARLVQLVSEASRTLDSLWQAERLRSESAQLETLVNLGHSLVARLEERDLLATLTDSGRSLFAARLCTLHSHDAPGRSLQLQAWSGTADFPAAALPATPLREEESMLVTAVHARRVVEFQGLDRDGAAGAVDLPGDPALCSALAAPLLVDGAAAGVLTVYTAQPHRFSDAQKRLLAALASFAAGALHNARLYARVFHSEETLRKNQTLTTLGLLAAEIAHEIRNPLTVIKLLHGPIGADFGPADPRRRDLQVITEKIEQLEAIVTRVLSFARTPGTLHSRWSLAEIIDDTLLLLRAKLAQTNITVARPALPQPLLVDANKGQLQQVLLNLALNALHAMPHGGTLTLACSVEKRGGAPLVQLDLTDTGSGIPEPVQARLFEPFLSGRADGTGLGLAIARRIMLDHRGDLALAATGPQGTTLRVTLPLAGA